MASPTSASAAEARRTTRPLASEQDARRARRSLRRCTRGAAMVEALILVPVLILLDVSLLYMHSVYDTRLATMRGARREVWPYALGACETSSGPSVSKDGTDPSLAPLSGLFAQGKRIARGRTLLDPLDTGLDVGAASSVKASRGAAEVDGFRSHTMTTHSRVLCNERQDGISEADRRATIHLLYGQLL